MADTLSLGFYSDAALTQPLTSLALTGREGRFVDNHQTLYIGSPDPSIKWVSASGNPEICLYGAFDYDKWRLVYPVASPPDISGAAILLCLDADYVANDENCFDGQIYLPGEILGGVGNAIPVHVALNSYSSGDSDFFRLYTDLIEELPV